MAKPAQGIKHHLVIPDTQVAPGVPTIHLEWIGQYIVDEFRGTDLTVIHLGDHWDMASLSSYDKGKKAMEGRRYEADVLAGNDAIKLLRAPAARTRAWEPKWHFLVGNHEDRITRAVESDPQIEGWIGLHNLDLEGWEVHPFLEPLWLDGVGYAHYWYNPMTGRAYGGGTIENRLKTIGHSFTQGHQQELKYGLRFVAGRSQHGLVAGACYLHEEDYKGPQGNSHWRGIVACHQVESGSYDPMFVSLDYLARRYTGKRVEGFLDGRRSDKRAVARRRV